MQIIAEWEQLELEDRDVLVAPPIWNRQSGPSLAEFIEGLQGLEGHEDGGPLRDDIRREAAEVYLSEIGIIERSAEDETAELQAAM